MSKTLFDELADAAAQIAAFQVQAVARGWRPFVERSTVATAPASPPLFDPTEEVVAAISEALFQQLTAGRDLGFAMMIRTNLPRNHIENAVRAAFRLATRDADGKEANPRATAADEREKA